MQEETSPENKRTTLREIAKHCGVSHSTVSRALQNSPLISAKRREQIQKAALDLHYKPDPMVAALCKYRIRQNESQPRCGIALVIGKHLLNTWADLIESARNQALRLGFYFELYVWNPDITFDRHSHILKSRGIRAIILGPLTELNALETAELDWDYFAVVTLGNFTTQSDFNCVAPNHFTTMKLSLEWLKQKGYQRPAFVTYHRINLRTRSQLLIAYTGQHLLSFPNQNPLHYLIPTPFSNSDIDTLKTWQNLHKPDAWVSHRFLKEIAENAGIEFGKKRRFIATDLMEIPASEYQAEISGVIHPNVEIGIQAVNLLSNEIIDNSNRRSCPPKSIYVTPRWKEPCDF